MAELWLSPEYSFRVQKPGAPGILHEIVIDVTLSAPTFGEPSKAMKNIFTHLEKNYLAKGAKILDFGAAKLRNTLYLYNKGHRVFPVEFAKVFQTEQGKKALAKAQKYCDSGRLRLLVYPHEFKTWTSKVDIALLINVLNIMPVPAERDVVLQECHNKLKQRGYLLWYSQYGDQAYNERCTDDVRLGDGFYIGSRRHYKTFYREFSTAEMDSIMSAHGFSFVQSYPVHNNHVRLYQKTSSSPLRRVVSRTRLRREIAKDVSIAEPTAVEPKEVRKRRVVRPDPPSVSHGANLAEAVERLPRGAQYAGEYVSLVRSILEFVLVPARLRKIISEKRIYSGRKRVDLFGRVSNEGFFSQLRQKHGIPAPYVHIECKNYSVDINNPEFDQLAGRFSAKKGQFGLLICRSVADEKAALARSRDATEKNDYILVITDVDLARMIELRRLDDFEGIDDFFEEQLENVVL